MNHPTSSMVYKLVTIEDARGEMKPVAKKADGKRSLGGRKVAWRQIDSTGYATKETVVIRRHNDYAIPNSPTERALQVVFMENGEQVVEHTIEEMRQHHKNAISELRDYDKTINSGQAAFTA